MRCMMAFLVLCSCNGKPRVLALLEGDAIAVVVQVTSTLPASKMVSLRATATPSSAATVVFVVDDNEVATATRSATGDYTASFDSRLVSDGPHLLEAVATEGGRQFSSGELAFIVDNTPATASFSAPAANAYVNPTRTSLQLAASDASGVARVRFMRQGTELCSLTAPPFVCAALGSLVDGPMTFDAEVTDAAGNTALASLALNIDTTPPTGGFSSPTQNGFINPAIKSFVVTGSDPGGVALVRFRRTGQSGVLCEVNTPPFECLDTAGGLVEGVATYDAILIDAAGNQTLAQRSVTVDLRKPKLITVEGPAPLPWSAIAVDNVAKFPRFYFRFDEQMDPLSRAEICEGAPDCSSPEAVLDSGFVSFAPGSTNDYYYLAPDRLSDELGVYYLDVRGLRDRAGNPPDTQTVSLNEGLFSFHVAPDKRHFTVDCGANAATDNIRRATILHTLGVTPTCRVDFGIPPSAPSGFQQSTSFYNNGGNGGSSTVMGSPPGSFATYNGVNSPRRHASTTMTLNMSNAYERREFAYTTATPGDAVAPLLTGSYVRADANAFMLLAFSEKLDPRSLGTAVATVEPGGLAVRLDMDPLWGIVEAQAQTALAPGAYTFQISGLKDPQGNTAALVSVPFVVSAGSVTAPTLSKISPVADSVNLSSLPSFDVVMSARVDRASTADGAGFALFDRIGVEQHAVPVRGFTSSKLDDEASALTRAVGTQVFYTPFEAQALAPGSTLRLDLRQRADNGPTMMLQSLNYTVGTVTHRPTFRDVKFGLVRRLGTTSTVTTVQVSGVAIDDDCNLSSISAATTGPATTLATTSVLGGCGLAFDVNLSSLAFANGANSVTFIATDANAATQTLEREVFLFPDAPSITAPTNGATNVLRNPTLASSLSVPPEGVFAMNNIAGALGNKTIYFAFAGWSGGTSSAAVPVDDTMAAVDDVALSIGVFGYSTNHPESGFSLFLSDEIAFTTAP